MCYNENNKGRVKMAKKRNAFTLVEILIVIALLGVLITIVVPNTISLVKKQRQKAYDTMIATFEKAAELYVSGKLDDITNTINATGYYTITLSTLANEGYIKSTYTNPIDNNEISLENEIIITKGSDLVMNFCYEERGTCPDLTIYRINESRILALDFRKKTNTDSDKAIVKDLSNNGYDATLMNFAYTTASGYNNTLVFDGTDDYLDVADGFSDLTGGFTYGVYAYPTSTNSWERYMDFGVGTTNNILFARNSTTNNLSIQTFSGATAGNIITATGPIALNAWQYFVVTVDAAANVTMYKDGAPIQTGTLTYMPPVVTRTTNYIGKSNWADAYYKGNISWVVMYNRALTSTEINQVFNYMQSL